MSKDVVRFKWLTVKPVGSNTVSFQLEDGALVEVKIDVSRAGVAVDYRNPDGTPHYNVAFQQSVIVIPPDRTYLIPKDQLAGQLPKAESKDVYR